MKNLANIKRIYSAFGYSLAGLKHASKKEPAFQQELFILLIMSAITVITPFTIESKIAIIITHLLILIVELLNSAIEAVVDIASPEHQPLAKQSKDMASAAVLLAFFISITTWLYAIYQLII